MVAAAPVLERRAPPARSSPSLLSLGKVLFRVGAFLAAIILGLTRSIGSVGFPLFVDGAMFMIMALVLIFRPQGLLGRPEVEKV